MNEERLSKRKMYSAKAGREKKWRKTKSKNDDVDGVDERIYYTYTFLFYNYFNIKMHLNFLFRLMYFTSWIGLSGQIYTPYSCMILCPEMKL